MDISQNEVLHYQGEELFYKQLKKGRLLGLLPRTSPKYRLLSLEKLHAILPSTGETDGGLEDVPLARIIGSENRSDDFTGDFYPRREWMRERWIKVLIHMQSATGFDPVWLIEYGGYYFIRDGNHRVSIAKALKREFISAHIRRQGTSLNLPESFNYESLPLWKEQVSVHRRRDFFNYVDPALFDVRRCGTWTGLEKTVYSEYPHRFKRENKRPPESAEELIEDWKKNIYDTTMVYIEQNSLLYLLPGWGSTDVFLDICRFWVKQPKAEDYWLEEIYRLYSARLHRKRFLLVFLKLGAKTLATLTEDKETALDRFRQVTRQKEFIPEFTLPSCSKKLIRYLYRQVYLQYALFLKRKYRRAPYISELTLHWYKNYYKPLYEHYQTLRCQRSFTGYYIVFSKRYFREFENNCGDLTPFVKEYCRTCPIRNDAVT